MVGPWALSGQFRLWHSSGHFAVLVRKVVVEGVERVDINYMAYKDGVWRYRANEQLLLVADCRALLDWDIFKFDCWLLDSNGWGMYTLRRCQLIELRTSLVNAWKSKANDFVARNLLIMNFCLSAWKKTRTPELRGQTEVLSLESVYRKAKVIRRRLGGKAHSKKQVRDARLMPHAIMLGWNQLEFWLHLPCRSRINSAVIFWGWV